jgi:hypothetical protein
MVKNDFMKDDSDTLRGLASPFKTMVDATDKMTGRCPELLKNWASRPNE